MEKKYKIKDEFKSLLILGLRDKIYTQDEWSQVCGLSEKILEEVPQRIELNVVYIDSGTDNPDFKASKEQTEICEQAINGELFTKKDMKCFSDWFARQGVRDDRTIERWRSL